MGPPRELLARRYLAALTAGEADAVVAAWTPDVILDRRNSNAPWRGITRGRAEARAVYEDFLASAGETLEDFRWEVGTVRAVGRDLVAAETRISGRGRSSGIEAGASGGWTLRFEGELIAEVVLHQSVGEALLAARRWAIREARLYFVCDARPRGHDPARLVAAAIRGGADVIQLRDKGLGPDEIVSAARPFRAAADEHGALFFLNDYPELVATCGADGVHVGQDDAPVAEARAAAGAAALVGLSTHSPEQFDDAIAAAGDARPDQVSVGPVWETPTKEGRPATGLDLIRHAAASGCEEPAWFAIGGIDESNVAEVVGAGASRIVVVRAIRDAADPGAAARTLRAALERTARR